MRNHSKTLALCFKFNGSTKAKKVSHGDFRDDRPSHGRDVRASTDGLAASRQVNTMVSLYTGVPATGFRGLNLQHQPKASQMPTAIIRLPAMRLSQRILSPRVKNSRRLLPPAA
jgi:hypothetical protein